MNNRKLFALGLVLSTLSVGIFPPYIGFIALVISIVLMMKGSAGKGVYLFIQAILLASLGMAMGAYGIYNMWGICMIVSFIVDAFAIWMSSAET